MFNLLNSAGALLGMITFLVPARSGQFHNTPVAASNRVRIVSRLDRDYFLASSSPQDRDYIQRDLAQDNREAAQWVGRAFDMALCFGVDPLVFVSLVWQESSFKPSAVSYTGAVGLTQMTEPALKEISDHLVLTSHRRMTLLRRHVRDCAADLLSDIPAADSQSSLSHWKWSLVDFPDHSLMLGAVLLKLYLAEGAENGVENYRVALERYNGEPTVKAWFADQVLSRVSKWRKRRRILIAEI